MSTFDETDLTCQWCKYTSPKVGVIKNTYDSKTVRSLTTRSGWDTEYGTLTLCPVCYFAHLYPDSCDDEDVPPKDVNNEWSLQQIRDYYKAENEAFDKRCADISVNVKFDKTGWMV